MLKANSGHYDLRPGMAIPDSIFNPDQAALEAGFEMGASLMQPCRVCEEGLRVVKHFQS